MMRQPQRINRGIATHEADAGALDPGIEPRRLDDQLVDSRRDEAGARGHHEVRDAVALAVDPHRVDRLQRQPRRGLLEACHPRRGAGELARRVEPFGVGDEAVGIFDRLEEREAPLDARAADHPPEDRGIAALGDETLDEAHERIMDVVRRHRRADAVDMRRRRHRYLQDASRPSLLSRANPQQP